MILRKFLDFVLTTLLTGIILSFLFVITDGIQPFLVLGVLLAGIFPFVLFIGVPVSFLSDYLTRNINGKQRYTKAFVIHMISGLTTGMIISFFFEGFLLVGVTVVASILFWSMDELLRKKI